MTTGAIRTYLKRIGIHDEGLHKDVMQNNVRCDLHLLSRLQWAHMCSVPFENIDIMRGKQVSLEREHLYRKIVTERRGGVCSELNTLYNWLLESLGFDPVSFSSRVISEAVPYPGRSHRVMRVILNGHSYITDAGYNYEHHRKPLQLEEDLIQCDGECDYVFRREEVSGWVLYQRPAGGKAWRRKISFTEDPWLDSDFTAPTFFAQYHPDSKINKALKVSLYKNGIFRGIRQGDHLEEHGGIVKILEPGISAERTDVLLKEEFGLDIEQIKGQAGQNAVTQRRMPRR